MLKENRKLSPVMFDLSLKCHILKCKVLTKYHGRDVQIHGLEAAHGHNSEKKDTTPWAFSDAI